MTLFLHARQVPYISSVVANVLLFMLSASVCYKHLSLLPFYVHRTNLLRGGIYAALTCATFRSVVVAVVNATPAANSRASQTLQVLFCLSSICACTRDRAPVRASSSPCIACARPVIEASIVLNCVLPCSAVGIHSAYSCGLRSWGGRSAQAQETSSCSHCTPPATVGMV